MNKSIFTNFWLLLMAALVFSSCGDDAAEPDAGGPIEATPNGFYVYGTNTIAESPADKPARMAGAALNPAKSGNANTMAGVYGKFMHIGANSTIQFTHAENEVSTVYGAAGGGTVSPGAEIGFTDINDTFIHGTLVADGDPINVSEEGLYYVFVNTLDNTFRIMKAKPQVFGPAAPFGYDAGVPLPLKSSNATTSVFEATNVPLKGADGYRYRFNTGYEVFNNLGENGYEAGEFATVNQLAIPPTPEAYDAAWAHGPGYDIGYYDANMPNHEGGKFTLTLTYDAETDTWTETKTRTGDLDPEPNKDYSAIEIGLFGNAYTKDSGEQGDWTDPYGVTSPTTVDGDVYTWTWENVALMETGEFVILEGGTWDGHTVAILYNDATSREGEAFTSGAITNSGANENFVVATGGVYNISLEIDAAADSRTLIITPAN